MGRETVDEAPPAIPFVQPAVYPPPMVRVTPTTLQENYAMPAEVTYFSNCSDARAAGAAPVRSDDPGYGFHLDRDRDGVGCE